MTGPGRPRVVIVRQSSTIDAQVRREVEALRSSGCDVELVMQKGAASSIEHPWPDVRIIELPVTRDRAGSALEQLVAYGAFALTATIVVALRHVRRRYAAVQVTTMPDPLVVAGMIPKVLGARLVLFVKEPVPELFETLHGASERRSRLLRRVQRWSMRRADVVVTVTPEMRQLLVENGAPDGTRVVLNASVVVPTGTESRRACADHFTVLCHGLMAERYGLHTAIRAARRAADAVPGLRIWLVGDGPARADLESLADAFDVRDVVTFTGFVSDQEVVERLGQADLGLVLQRASPYAHLVHTTKMYEYFNFGVPVVATRLRATENHIPKDAIRFIEPDDADDLADAIVELAADPVRRCAMAAAAADVLASASWDHQQVTYLAAFGLGPAADEPGAQAEWPT